MKTPALACALLCFFAAPELTKAQDLADLRHIGIVIEDLDQDSKSVGLTQESLSDMVLVALKRDVPKLKIDNQPLRSFFYVRITSLLLDNGAASKVDVTVERPAEIAGDNSSKILSGAVTVWHRGGLFTGSTSHMASRIRDCINDIGHRIRRAVLQGQSVI